MPQKQAKQNNFLLRISSFKEDIRDVKKNMYIEKQKLNNVPTVFVYENKITSAAKNGTILFYHGLGASKDIQLHDLKRLARDGFLVIGVDNVGHGERRYIDFDKRFSSDNPNFETNLQQAVYETAIEVPKLIHELYTLRLIKEDKIGITGISMGGFITYRAILECKKLKAAVSILGSPKWKNNNFSPHLFIEKFYPLPLCSLNAGNDQSVPAHNARDFHDSLQKYYQEELEKISYVEYPDSGHFMKENDWDELWHKMVTWFHKWL